MDLFLKLYADILDEMSESKPEQEEEVCEYCDDYVKNCTGYKCWERWRPEELICSLWDVTTSTVTTKKYSMNSTVKSLSRTILKKTKSTWSKSTYIIGEVADEYFLFLWLP